MILNKVFAGLNGAAPPDVRERPTERHDHEDLLGPPHDKANLAISDSPCRFGKTLLQQRSRSAARMATFTGQSCDAVNTETPPARSDAAPQHARPWRASGRPLPRTWDTSVTTWQTQWRSRGLTGSSFRQSAAAENVGRSVGPFAAVEAQVDARSNEPVAFVKRKVSA